MKKLTFEIRSPAHQQNAIHAVQQILPDPTKPIVVTIQERNRSLDQNRKLWACLGDVSRQVEWHGRWLDAESWKCVFTAALKQQDVVPNLAGNGFVVIDAPRDKCTLSCAINGIHAAFHYLKKNYISGCVMTVPTG
ncbi:TPA: recombination protein NinB [Escherichia coli]|nr:recombination protein NinB [Escherichia coli]